MKNLILIVAVALSLPTCAQRMELGANVGINFSVSGSMGNFSPDYSIKAAYNICEKLQLGLSGNIHWQTCELNAPFYYPVNPATGMTLYYADNGEPRTAYSIKGFVNAKCRAGRTVLYTGCSGGLVVALPLDHFFMKEQLRNGYTVGGQAGATFYISRNFGINTELGANYININRQLDEHSDMSHMTQSGWNFPLSIGIRYNLR